jgi:hypothetical protein
MFSLYRVGLMAIVESREWLVTLIVGRWERDVSFNDHAGQRIKPYL